MSESEIVQKVWEQNTAEMRQMDTQRATLSNIILVLDLALIGVLVGSDPPKYAIFLSSLLVVLGFYGIFSVAKFYERYKYYKNRANTLLREMSKTIGIDIAAMLDSADAEHEKLFPRWVKFKVYWIWYIVHIFAVLAGFYLICSEMGS